MTSQLDLALAPPRPSIIQTSKCATCRGKFRWVSGALCRGPCDQPVCDGCSFGESLAWCRACLIARKQHNRAARRSRKWARQWSAYACWAGAELRRQGVAAVRATMGCYDVPGMRVMYSRPHLEGMGLGNEAGFTTRTDSPRSGQADPLWHQEGTVQGPVAGAFAGTHAYVLWDGDEQPVIVGLRALARRGEFAACESRRPMPEPEPRPASPKVGRRQRRAAARAELVALLAKVAAVPLQRAA